MTDVYVYHFKLTGGRAGEKIVSKRRATPDAIKTIGEPVMESQMVVDRTEVDDNGFLVKGVDDASNPLDELSAQIRSLERRANSRDCEARELDESVDGRRQYMLSLESRELRNQSQRLKKQRAGLMDEESGSKADANVFATFGDSSVAG